MLKGCQKQMIVLHGTGSEIFEEAYFILKPGRGGSDKTKAAMLLEANRIVEECRTAGRGGVTRRVGLYSVLIFVAGVVLGAGLILLAWVLS